MSERFRHTHVHPDLAAEFSDTFTRIEYALKASGFADGGNSGVVAAWDRFANSIDGTLTANLDKELRDGVAFLLNEPARKQVLSGYIPLALDAAQSETQRVLLVVRTVRNNLVHGGKIQPDGEKEAGRNERLVASSLVVLKIAAEVNELVRQAFLRAGT